MSAFIPLELIQHVARYSQPGEQAALVRVTRSCWSAVGPYLWNEVHCDERTLRLLVDAALCRANMPVAQRTYSPSDVKESGRQERLYRLRLIAGWVRVLHLYPDQYTYYRWPLPLFDKIQEATGYLPTLPRLCKVLMHRDGLKRPSRLASHLAHFFLHPRLQSLEFLGKGKFSGLDLTYGDAWKLCRRLQALEVPLKRLSLRCAYIKHLSIPQYIKITLMLRCVGRLQSLTHISISGSLLNATALLSFGSMPLLSNLQVVGDPVEDVNDNQLDDTSFPSLRCLGLRYVDDEQTSAICSIACVMRSLHEVTIEWDTDIEPGFAGIDETVSAIVKQGTSIRHLHLKLQGCVTARRAHCIPACVWQNSLSEVMESVALLGFSLAIWPFPTLQGAVKATWPNLKTLTQNSTLDGSVP